MACDTPYYKRIDGYLEELPLPCNKCPQCKSRRLREWIFRLKQESKDHASSLFVTLTYDNENCPVTDRTFKTLEPEHMTQFMKMVRHLTPNKVKFYLVGEYGGQTKRPHYHVLLFGCNYFHKIATKCWKRGSIHVGIAEGPSIAYTLDYMNKKKVVPEFENDDRVPEFTRMSRGLGKGYLTTAMRRWHLADLRRCYVEDGKYRIPLPKYYRDKIYDDEQKSIQRMLILEDKRKNEREKRIYLDGLGIEDELDYAYKEKIGRLNKFNYKLKKLKDEKL